MISFDPFTECIRLYSLVVCFDRFLIAESYGISNEVRNQYYDHGSIPFNFALIQYLNKSCNALCVKSVIKNSLADLSPSYWPNFVVSTK